MNAIENALESMGVLIDEATQIWCAVINRDWSRLESMDSDAIELLIEALKDKVPWRRVAAAEAVGEVGGDRAVIPLITALQEGPQNVKSVSAWKLGTIGDERAIEPLIRTLKEIKIGYRSHSYNDESMKGYFWNVEYDKNFGLRGSAAIALGEIGNAKAVKPLIEALQNKDFPIQVAASKALGQIRDHNAVEPLIDTLKRGDPSVQYYAAEALGNIGNKQAIKPLITAFIYTFRSTYWGGYSDEGPRKVIGTKNPSEDQSFRRLVVESVAQFGDAAINPLIVTLKKSTFNYQREMAAEALGKIGNSRSVKPLIRTLKRDKDYGVRFAAARALGLIGDTKAVKPLIRSLLHKGSFPSFQESIAEALGDIGDARAVEPLIATLEKLKSVHVGLRPGGRGLHYPSEAVIEALGKIGGKRAVETLIFALQTKGFSTKAAAKALGEMRDVSAVEPLCAELERGLPADTGQLAAAEALGKIGGAQAEKALSKALKKGDSFLYEVAIKALEQIKVA